MKFVKCLILVCCLGVFVFPGIAKDKPHSNFFKTGEKGVGAYCLFCHKLRNPENVRAIWKLDSEKSSYNDYISATTSADFINYQTNPEIDYRVISIVELCLGCHDMTKHDNIYGHSFASKVVGNTKTKISVKIAPDGKISGKLKLYNNVMTCTTCHDPHESSFKLLTDSMDKLCNDCHNK